MATRDLAAGQLAMIQALAKRPVLFYEGEFTGGTLRLWSGVGTISWNSQSWTGAGTLLGIGPIQETTEIRASGTTLSLNGVSSSIISVALAQCRQGLPGRVWLGGLDSSNAVIADPYMAFEGRLDVPEISDDGETCSVSVSYESRLIMLERPRERRVTHEDQQIDYPGDRFREYITGLQDKVVVW
jgi:hypothetical protein